MLTLLSCGKADKTAAAASAKPVATGSGSAARAPAGSYRPTPTILGRWTPPADAEAYAFADLGALLKTELFQRIQTSLMLLAQTALPKQGLNCTVQWVHALRQVAGAGNDKEQLAVFSYEPAAVKTPLGECLGAFGGPAPIKLPNAKEAYALDNRFALAVLPDAVVIGTRALVEASLSKTPARAEWPQDLVLSPSRQIVVLAKKPQEQLDIFGYLSVSKSHFATHSEVSFPTEAAAKAVAESVAPVKIKENFLDHSPWGDDRLRDRLLEHWHVRQSQRSVAFEFSTDGTPDEMAQQLGLASAISIFQLRKHIAATKTQEARRGLRAIADHVIASHPKKLVSFPPVPQRFDLLQGRKYQSAPDDWSSWKPIDFSMSEPQYYQYQVEASKDGKSALVIAEGDLDANGQRSHFSLQIKRDPKTRELVASPTIDERDPLE